MNPFGSLAQFKSLPNLTSLSFNSDYFLQVVKWKMIIMVFKTY